MARQDSLDMLLIGRAGNGKSTTGNTILGRESFVSTSDTQSQTISVKYDVCEFDGDILRVVDCPGLGDTRLGVHLDVKQLSDEIQKAITDNPDGFHAIVYITRFGNRFDKFDVKALETIASIMGEAFIQNHCIILMTGGDMFDTDPEIKKCNRSFEHWVSLQKNDFFKKLVKDCQGRILLFDNRTEDQNKMFAQKKKLIQIIKNMTDRYTNAAFEKSKDRRNKLIETLKYKQELIDYIDKIGILISRLKNTTYDPHEHSILIEIEREGKNCVAEVEKKYSQNIKLKSVLKLLKLFLEIVEMRKQRVQILEELEKKYLEIKIKTL